MTRRVNLLVAELQDIFLGKAQEDNTKINVATAVKRIPLEEGLKLAGLTLVPTENATGTNEATQEEAVYEDFDIDFDTTTNQE